MNQISDAEAIFRTISIPMTGEEVKAISKIDDSCLIYEIDWQKRTVTCLLRKRTIDKDKQIMLSL